jgi:CRISPR-associated protein Csy1
MRFSEETKEAKEYRKKNAYHTTGFDDVFDLTITAFGGTQPQNVSVLNSQNAGRAYLLPSCPPVLTRRKVRLPTTNFFKNSLYAKSFQDAFQSLDKLIKADINNLAIRQGIQNNLKYIIEQVLHQVFTVRQYPLGWSKSDYYQSLPYAQRIWLDDIYEEQRENQADWLDEIVREFANWILDTYEYLCKDTVTKLSDFELREVRQIVKQVIQKDQEFLK